MEDGVEDGGGVVAGIPVFEETGVVLVVVGGLLVLVEVLLVLVLLVEVFEVLVLLVLLEEVFVLPLSTVVETPLSVRVTVTVFALEEEPTVTEPKESEEGETERTGVARLREPSEERKAMKARTGEKSQERREERKEWEVEETAATATEEEWV